MQLKKKEILMIFYILRQLNSNNSKSNCFTISNNFILHNLSYLRSGLRLKIANIFNWLIISFHKKIARFYSSLCGRAIGMNFNNYCGFIGKFFVKINASTSDFIDFHKTSFFQSSNIGLLGLLGTNGCGHSFQAITPGMMRYHFPLASIGINHYLGGRNRLTTQK
ncbi:MAG: hypothetical protein A2Y80_02190 [Deltaproteobacteria bacterium RBG_13_58_19]|nr:MAG: hypothetical protein A2Y80_02190 [Deltaproteobacteria bacterium RBG_13_58_19]